MCHDTTETRRAIADAARRAVDATAVKPTWSAMFKETYDFSPRHVIYLVNFAKPPVVYAMVTTDCRGAVTDVQINDWGTLQ